MREYLTQETSACIEIDQEVPDQIILFIDDQDFSANDLRETALLLHTLADDLESSLKRKH